MHAGEQGQVSLGVDIGGTFTDVVLVDAGGGFTTGKYLTTPADPTEGLLRGVRDVLERTGTAAAAVGRFAHATTLATNVILQRQGADVAFVTNTGFGSMLTLGRNARVEESRFDLFFDAAEPPIPRARCFEVPGRILADGRELEPFDDVAARAVLAEIAAAGVAAVAICFLHSYLDPSHEARMAELARTALPGLTVVASSEVWPELREYERASTTLMSAYVGPVMEGYLLDLRRRLDEFGVTAPIHVMGSGGGVMSARFAAQRAVYTIESGPAAGVVAARNVGAGIGAGDVISFDMGGTTAKAGVVRGGRPDITHDFHVGGSGSFGGGREGTGVPIKVPAIDLAEVGSGGGSIAWVDGGRALRVGPRSAGADPGPACYGLGGDRPTVTDADLLLGYLDPATFAGGTVGLHRDLSEKALRRHVCEPLGIGVVEAALAIHDIANANMSSAVHVVTVQRGVDPRRFAMVALGGAGPMHVARVAERFDIDTVLVPFGTGVGSAIGLLTSDVTAERSRTSLVHQSAVDVDDLEARFAALAAACAEDLETEQADLAVERMVDMRYVGQAHEITVVAPDGELDAAWMGRLLVAFAARYAEVYGQPLNGPVELVSLRVKVSTPASTSWDQTPVEGAVAAPPVGRRRVTHFAELGRHDDTPVHDRSCLGVGAVVPGPAIIEEAGSTIVIPPSWTGTVDERANVVLTRRR